MDARARRVSPLERAFYLRSLPPLADLDSAELAVVAQHAQERAYRKGGVLLRRGERVGSFHVITSGTVRTSGSEHGESVLGPRQVLGLVSMLARREEGLEATAESDVSTLEIDADDYFDVLEDHFPALVHTLQGLARRIFEQRLQIPDGSLLAPAAGAVASGERGFGLVERVIYLRGSTALREANLDALIELARSLEEVTLPAGSVLWRRGDPSGSLYVVLEGRFRAALDDAGRHFLAGPGYPLGNLESICRLPRWYTATAHTGVVALRGHIDVYLDILEDHFEMAQGVLGAMAVNLLTLLAARRAADPPPLQTPPISF